MFQAEAIVKKQKFFFLILSVLFVGILAGCTQTVESVRKVWGSSIQRLEQERVRAVRDVYSCEYDKCYQLVHELSRPPKQSYKIFQYRPDKNMFVVIGVPGNVDTTEVGIFLSPIKINETAVEVSSLSSSAKRKVAQAIRAEMEIRGY